MLVLCGGVGAQAGCAPGEAQSLATGNCAPVSHIFCTGDRVWNGDSCACPEGSVEQGTDCVFTVVECGPGEALLVETGECVGVARASTAKGDERSTSGAARACAQRTPRKTPPRVTVTPCASQGRSRTPSCWNASRLAAFSAQPAPCGTQTRWHAWSTTALHALPGRQTREIV